MIHKTLDEIATDMVTDGLERAVHDAAYLEQLKRKEMLTPAEVEKLYSLNARTLANKRVQGKGPRYVKVGKIILYPQTSLRAYQEAHLVRTSDQR